MSLNMTSMITGCRFFAMHTGISVRREKFHMRSSFFKAPKTSKTSFNRISYNYRPLDTGHAGLYFIRHGKTEYNEKRLVCGSLDPSLTSKGEAESHVAARVLDSQSEKISTIITSPMLRCIETAKIISKRTNLGIKIMEDLREVNFGVMEGCQIGDTKWISRWVEGGMIEGAESRKEFSDRVMKAFRYSLKFPGPVLIVSHGGVWIELLKLLDIEVWDIPNSTPFYINLQSRIVKQCGEIYETKS